MKLFRLAFIIAALAVYIAGAVWYYIDRGKGGHKKAPMILRAVGALLMAVYFILLIVGCFG